MRTRGAHASAVEVRASYAGRVLGSSSLRCRRDGAYRIGASSRADVAVELPDGRDVHTLVACAAGDVCVRAGAGMRMRVRPDDGTAWWAVEVGALATVTLREGMTVEVEVGAVRFAITRAPVEMLPAMPTPVDRRFWRYNGMALVCGVPLLLGLLTVQTAASAAEPEISPEMMDVILATTRLGTSEPSPLGRAEVHYAPVGPRDALPGEHVDTADQARRFDPDMAARNAGILSVLAQDSGEFLSSPYGAAFAVGNDEEDVWAGLTGTEVGEAFGTGGLGLVGTGRGGRGTGEGSIGLGNVGLVDGGAGEGYRTGRGWGQIGSRSGARVPRVRQGKAKVKGAIDKDIVRRIVRAHINEVRHCYNQGLARAPKLSGRVSVQFTIEATGRVPAAVVAHSTVSDTEVGTCIARAVERWKFPRHLSGGGTVVTYPFVLTTR